MLYFYQINMNKFINYFETIEYLERLKKMSSTTNLKEENQAEIFVKRTQYFLDLMGNPEKNLKFIHVAGTAGKGTVTHLIHEIIFASGKKVGSFTSPSLIVDIERIKVQDKYIDPEIFAEITENLKPLFNQAYSESPFGVPTFFEIMLIIALVYFQKQNCEFVLLEAGIGGRYDATNVIKKPFITVITNIGFDHTEILGKTLEEIAFDKAGIIKPESSFFTTEKRPELLKIFQEICTLKKSSFTTITTNSADNYQISNQLLAEAVARKLGISEFFIKRGLKNKRMAGRFEIIQKNPLLILDGAHNHLKIRTVLENLKTISYKKLYLIIGIADNKDHVLILKQIIPVADFVYFTCFQNKERKCTQPKFLLAQSKKYLKREAKAKVFLEARSALESSLKKAKADDLVLVVGSFFLVSELRKIWFSENYILKKRKSF